jgi:DNA-3-methyladenine glycosylase
MLTDDFFDRDAAVVAKDLLGKVIFFRHGDHWLKVSIIETEAYYLHDKGSHASLGFTEKRKALFMPAGTIYMYYARGADSFNVSCHGEGNAVLIKSGMPFTDDKDAKQMIAIMQQLNPHPNKDKTREIKYLCSGQTLLCKSLGLRVKDWDGKSFDAKKFFIKNCEYTPKKIIQTRRLGIPLGRDEQLPYRFIDYDRAPYCTENPLTKTKWQLGKEYFVINNASHEVQHV